MIGGWEFRLKHELWTSPRCLQDSCLFHPMTRWANWEVSEGTWAICSATYPCCLSLLSLGTKMSDINTVHAYWWPKHGYYVSVILDSLWIWSLSFCATLLHTRTRETLRPWWRTLIDALIRNKWNKYTFSFYSVAPNREPIQKLLPPHVCL